MAPSRTSKSVYKRSTNEPSPEKDSKNSSKTKQRKKRLTLGPHWTKGELERFYEAYRKHGRDWKKVTAAVRNNRSVDMVEALFNMNRAYLSLPEGIASVAGLIAMVTDHYSVIEESESEEEEEVYPQNEGCLSFLKLTQTYGMERRATGRRTPRVLITSEDQSDDREEANKRDKKQLEADEDEKLALALANALSQSKHRASSMSKNVVRISRDRRHIKEVLDRDGALLMGTKGVGNKEVPQKVENVGFEEAEGDASDDRGGDELEALQALAALSGSLRPDDLKESGEQRLKKDRIANKVDEKPHAPVTFAKSYHRRTSKQAGPEESLLPTISAAADASKPKPAQEITDANAVSIGELGTSKRKRKTLHIKEPDEDDNSKRLKTSLTSDRKITRPDVVVSATQVSGSAPAQRPPNRRKMSLKTSEATHRKPRRCETNSKHELLKEQVSNCLSHPLVRRRCIYEWFYSAIDYPWFAKMEFIDFLNHLGIGNGPRLTRLEWSVIKNSLGRTRRFSEKFLQEEREKLEQYRESARKHYTEVRGGAREEGVPREFAQPLSVGNRVIAIHPNTREARDGKILTVHHDKCNVLFDNLGVHLVMDIDIMPLNPLEDMPDGLRRKQIESTEAEVLNRHPSSDASALFPPPVLENIDFSMIPPKQQDDRDRRVTTDQSCNIASNNARPAENQRALVLEHTSDAEEMEPEVLGIVSGSRSIAQAMVDAAMKAASLAKDEKDARNVVLQALDDAIVSIIKQEDQTNGRFDHHHHHHHQSWSRSDTEGLMTSELIASCLSTWLMIQRCTEKQYPPADIVQVMELAVRSLEPRCPQNMPIYREIKTCMGWITNQIMTLVKT